MSQIAELLSKHDELEAIIERGEIPDDAMDALMVAQIELREATTDHLAPGHAEVRVKIALLDRLLSIDDYVTAAPALAARIARDIAHNWAVNARAVDLILGCTDEDAPANDNGAAELAAGAVTASVMTKPI